MPPTTSLKAAVVWVLVVAGAPVLVAAPAQAKAGACTIVGTAGDDVLTGTGGPDVICGLGGDDRILGRGGDDVLRGGGGADVVRGGPGADRVAGGRGDDRVFGQAGDDVVRGDGGDDEVVGGRGNDRLGGFRGADQMQGEGDPSGFVDEVRCGPGPDTASADPADEVRRDCETVNQSEPPTDITLVPASISENEPVGSDIGDLTAVDTDAGDSHSFSLVPGAGADDNALVRIDGDSLESAVRYDFEVDSSFNVRVRATDEAGGFTEKAFTVAVTDTNDPPVAVDDDATATEDTQLDLSVSGAGSPAANDTDQDGDPLTVSAVSSPTGGTVSLSGGQIHFVPAANLCGNNAGTFVYTVSDGDSGTDTGTVTVDITCADDAATAVDDARTVAEDSGATTLDVLTNDTDPENDPITISSFTDPAGGTVVLVGPGGAGTNLTYAPDPDFCNDPPPFDTFDYTVNGGDSATVRVTVTCGNDAPVAVDDDRTTAEDTPLQNPVTGAGSPAANDTDVDGDTLTVTAVTNPSGGTVGISSGQVTFTPTANLCGNNAASYDYTVSDGATPTAGTDTGTVTIDITCVNDAPVANDDTRTVAEDSGPTTFGTLLGNDTDVESDPITITGASDPASGSTSFTASDVTYTPDPNFCGADSFTYTVNGGDTATVSVTVTCANDAPSVDLDSTTGGTGSSATFTETDPHTGTGVLIAPNAEITDVDDPQIASATATLTNRPDGAGESIAPPASLPAGITVSGSTGPGGQQLVFTGPASIADFETAISGIRYDNTVNPPDSADRLISVVVNDGDADSNSATATVQVDPLNVAPVNTVPGAQSVNEDSSLAFTSGIAISVADVDNASLNVEVTVTHGTFTLSGTSGLTVTGNGTASVTMDGAIADLNAALNNATFAPNLDYNGPALLTIVTSDGSLSDTDTVDITVNPVNDGPTATNLSAAELYTEDTPRDLVDIVVSDVDNANVTVTLTLSTPAAGSLSTGTSGAVTSTYNAGTGVWTATGAIASVNTLLAGVVLTPASDFNASFSIATSVSDGIAPPATGSKTMTGIAVNDAPTSTAPGAQTTDEDVAKAISGMAVSDVDSSSLSVTLSVTNGTLTLASVTGLVFSTGDGAADTTMTFTGTLANLNTALATVTYTPTPDYNGSSVLTFSTNDGGAPVTKTVDITVTPVNDAPVAGDESFSGAIRNTTLVIDDPSDGAIDPPGPQKTIGGDILSGATDIDGPGPITVVPQTSQPTTQGGLVTIQADGDIVYVPPASCTILSDTFVYRVTDQVTESAFATVTIDLGPDCVWYVDQSAAAGGTGVSNSPFNILTPLNGTGGVGDVDSAGNYLFVYGGGTFTTGIVLEPNQRLYGQPEGLTVGGTALVAPGGTNPNIRNTTASGTGVTLANGVDVQAVNVGVTGSGSSFGIRGVGVTTATVGSDVLIQGNGLGFGLQGAAAGDVTVGATINDNTSAAVSVQQRTGGTVSISGPVTSTSINGTVEFVNNTGATLNVTGKLDISGALTTSLDVRGGGTFTATSSANTITGFLGLGTVGVNLDAVTVGAGGVVLNTLSTAPAGASNGLLVNNVTGTGAVTVNGGTLITSTRGVDVNGGTGDVTVGATLQSTGGRSVEVTGHTSGTVDLNGAVNENATGINLTGNTGATVRLDGGLVASTGANAAFNASGGGTVVVTGAANTLATSTGTALSVANTTIGAGGLTFRSISSSGAANGILLNTTGTSGGLTVTGNGGAGACTNGAPANCTGGTISNSTTDGISLAATRSPSFTRMLVTDSAGGVADEGIELDNVTGDVTLSGLYVLGAPHNAVHLDNNNTNLASLTVTGTTLKDPQPGTSANGLLVTMRGTSVLTAGSVKGSTIDNAFAAGIQVQTNDSSAVNAFDVGGTAGGEPNTIVNNNVGVDMNVSQGSDLSFRIRNNTFTGHDSQAINAFAATASTPGASMTGVISNNSVGTAGVVDSGSKFGSGIRAIVKGGTAGAFTVDGNTVREVPNARGIDLQGLRTASGAGGTKFRVVNNLVARPTGTAQNIGCGAGVPCPLASLVVIADNETASGDYTTCTQVAGNTMYDPTSWAAGGEAAYFLQENTFTGPSTLNLEGTQATPATQITTTNTVTNSAAAPVLIDGAVAVVAPGSCGSFPS